VEAGGLELHTHACRGSSSVVLHVDAVDYHGAAAWFEQSLDGAQSAGLSCPVGTQQTEDLTLVDVQTHAVDGRKGPVGDGQVADFEDVIPVELV
jgi:hypothetical protein